MSKNSLNSSMNLMGSADPLSEDFEFLSLFIEEAMSGVDVARQYPSFYQKLVNSPRLRQAFLDVIQLMEDDQMKTLETLPEPAHESLQFLMGGKHEKIFFSFQWAIGIEQLQEIFSPPQLVYRTTSDMDAQEEIRILHEEFFIEGIAYSVVLECALSKAPETGLLIWIQTDLSSYHNIVHSRPPMEATLHWGDYEESVLITKDGRLSLPHIPLPTIFDTSIEQIRSALKLVIKSS